MYFDKSKMECSVIPEGKKFLAYVGIGKGADRKRIKARGVTEDEAVRNLEKKLADLGFVQQAEEAPKLNMVINQFTSIPDFVREYRVNGIVEDTEKGRIKSRTAENYVYMLEHFERYFRYALVGDITVNALNQFFRAEEEKYAQTTLHKVEWVVHRAFSRAKEKKWISFNPFETVGYQAPKAKKETEEIEGLAPEELKELVGIIKSYPIIYNPIMLMLNTGMRTQEVIGLKWGDLDFQKDRLFVRQAVTTAVEFDEAGKIKGHKSIIDSPKTKGSKREIGLTPVAKEILLTWREEAPKVSKTKLGNDDFVFGHEKGDRFTYYSFRDKVNGYLSRQVGSIDKMRLHRFRHTVGTMLAGEGREVLQIMRQLGITQEKTLQRYIDKKGHNKIIAGNTDAISNGLSDMLRQSEKMASDKVAMQTILKAAEGLSDSNAKAYIMALSEMI